MSEKIPEIKENIPSALPENTQNIFGTLDVSEVLEFLKRKNLTEQEIEKIAIDGIEGVMKDSFLAKLAASKEEVVRIRNMCDYVLGQIDETYSPKTRKDGIFVEPQTIVFNATSQEFRQTLSKGETFDASTLYPSKEKIVEEILANSRVKEIIKAFNLREKEVIETLVQKLRLDEFIMISASGYIATHGGQTEKLAREDN